MEDRKTASRLGFKVSSRDARDRAALVDALQERPGQRFRASDLTGLTAGKAARPRGVPKSRVRQLLADVNGVNVSEDSGGFWFSSTTTPAARVTEDN